MPSIQARVSAAVSIAEVRAKAETTRMGPPRRDVRITEGTLGGVAGDWLEPSGAPQDAAILYLHGGAYVQRTPLIHRVLVAHVAHAAGLRAFMPRYRLAPEHPFPAALHDARACYDALLAQGVAPARCVVMGDSAGGGLTLALLLALRDDAPERLPAAGVGLSAWTDAPRDVMLRVHQLVYAGEQYAGEGDPRHPLVSPLFADPRGLPPLLLQVGGAEVLRGDSVVFAERARGGRGRDAGSLGRHVPRLAPAVRLDARIHARGTAHRRVLPRPDGTALRQHTCEGEPSSNGRSGRLLMPQRF